MQVKAHKLAITGRGGSEFPVPLEHPVLRVMPMLEGLLVEFVPRKDLQYSDVQALQRARH